MWPKALLELAPHLVRLVPAANNFFQNKSAGDEANRKALEDIAEGLRGDLGQTLQQGCEFLLRNQSGVVQARDQVL